MKCLRDIALISLVVILGVGLWSFRNYRRYEVITGEHGLTYIVDTRTGHVWYGRYDDSPYYEMKSLNYFSK
jgi:hypothetical protein